MKKGFALLAVIFVIVFFAVVGLVVVSMMSSESMLVHKQLNSTQAFFIATAGLNFYLTTSLEGDSDWSDNAGISKNFGRGSFTVSFTPLNANRGTMEVSGTVNNVTRTLSGGYRRNAAGLPTAFQYSMYSGNSGGFDLEIKNDVIITGDFYFYGDVKMKNESQLTGGTMYALDLELKDNASVDNSALAPAPDMPAFDSSSYDAMLDAVATGASDDLKLDHSDTFDLGGATHYFEKVELKDNGHLIGPGTIVVTDDDFKAEDDAIIDANINIIVAKDVEIKDDVNIGENVKIYAFEKIKIEKDVVYPDGGLLYSKEDDVEIKDDVNFSGVILAPEGKIKMEHEVVVNGLLYGDYLEIKDDVVFNGSIVTLSNTDIKDIKNDAQINFNATELPGSLTGFTGVGTAESASELDLWQEVL